MSKSNLRARLLCHRKRDSIEGHSDHCLHDLGVIRFIEDQTGWPIKKLARAGRIFTAKDSHSPNHRNTFALLKQSGRNTH